MLKSDRWIRQKAEEGMIAPYEPALIRKDSLGPMISYGQSSYGYDIRLSPAEFRIFRHIPGTVVDPKNFHADNLEPTKINMDSKGIYYILPAHSYGLGVAIERLEMPPNVTAICMGKSTYARCGIIANVTPAEAGWRGHLTLEFSNSSGADARIYANEGVVQLLFFEGEDCETTYNDRAGKYQDQGQRVTLAKA